MHLLERVAQDLELVQVLAADVDEDAIALDRVRGDQAALDQPVRDREHDLAVLEGARLGLVGVDDQVGRLAGALREEARLAASREEGAAAAAQARVEDLLDDRAGSISRLLERGEAAGLAVVGELEERLLLGAREDDELLSRHGFLSAAELLDDRRHVLGSNRLAIAVVDGHDGGPAAAAGALDRAQRHLAVVGRLAGADAELRLERLQHLLGADERAGDVRADLDQVLPDRLQMVHVVEGRDRHAVRGRLVERLRDLAERLGREPAVALLREPQRRQRRRARDRIERAHLLDLVVQRAHRSTSPMTASSEPTIAIRSATAASVMQVAVACSAAKDGARNLTRQGLGPPSETR